MKTIIELPDNLPPNGIGLALRAIADDILTGAVVPVPPFCYCIDTAVGLVTFWDSESDTLRDPPAAGNQAHPPLGTTLPDPWPKMIVEYDEMGAGWRRAVIMSARPESVIRLSPEVVYRGPSFYCEGSVSVPWTSEYVREVRTPDGTTLWKRPAAKVTT